MPRKFDKYGFNRQYLRRPCTRANPFPYRLPFSNGFSTRTLLYTVGTQPSTKVKSSVLAASVTRSGKEFKGINVTRSGKVVKSSGGKRMKLSEVSNLIGVREGELAALSSKAGAFSGVVEAMGQAAIAEEALINIVVKERKGGRRGRHRSHHVFT